MPRQRLTLQNMPLRGGLTTAGQQATVPETALWRATNCAPGLDGLMSKRPGLTQWGQTLCQPDPDADIAFYEDLSDLGNWDIGSSFNVNVFAKDNKMVIQPRPYSGTDGVSIVHTPNGSYADTSTGDCSVRFTLQGINLKSNEAIYVEIRSIMSNDMYLFVIQDDEIWYGYPASGTKIADYDVTTSPASSYEFRVDADGDTVVLINDEVVGALDTATYGETVPNLSDTYFRFAYVRAGAQTVTTSFLLSDIMFSSLASGMVPERLGAGTDFKTVIGGPKSRTFLVVAGEKYLYRDVDQKQFWSPLLRLTGGNVSIAQYKDELLIFDSDNGVGSTAWRWTGKSDPVKITDAPAVRFATEHRTRVFAAGDKEHPLRLYFSASNDPETWFAPSSDSDGQETVDEVLNAGWIDIPGEKGDEIVAVEGEFYGSCIVATNRGIWRITGSSPTSFVRENITTSVGASAQAAVTRMGNDLWMAGRQGISTIQTVQQFGDMRAGMPSAPIADLWAQGTSNSSIKVDQFQLYKSSMAWNPTLSLMYFAFAREGASDVSSVMTYNPVTQGWMGPWESDTTFVASAEVGSPITQVVMHGTSVGKVGLTDANYKTDFGESYTMTFESPYLCGRSLDPSLTHQTKTWDVLRLFFHVRGDWDVQVRWKCDDEDYQTEQRNTNVFKMPRLGKDWRLGVDPDGKIYTNQLVGVVEIPLETRGRYLKFDVSTVDAVAGEDLALQGYEIEFVPDGYEEE